MHRAFVMDWICFSAELVERGCTAGFRDSVQAGVRCGIESLSMITTVCACRIGWLRNVHVHAACVCVCVAFMMSLLLHDKGRITNASRICYGLDLVFGGIG